MTTYWFMCSTIFMCIYYLLIININCLGDLEDGKEMLPSVLLFLRLCMVPLLVRFQSPHGQQVFSIAQVHTTSTMFLPIRRLLLQALFMKTRYKSVYICIYMVLGGLLTTNKQFVFPNFIFVFAYLSLGFTDMSHLPY